MIGQHEKIHEKHHAIEDEMEAVLSDHDDLIGKLIRFLSDHTKKFHSSQPVER